MHFFLLTFIYSVIGSHQALPDSTYLTFILDKNLVTVHLLHWSKKGKSAAELNRFVDAHLSEIDPDKIIIIGDPNAKYPMFQPIIEVMKKHDWMEFKLLKKGEQLKAPEGQITLSVVHETIFDVSRKLVNDPDS